MNRPLPNAGLLAALFLVLVFATAPASAQLVINEIHADPDATNGDANNDGVVSTDDDEFVEIVNTSTSSVNISGFTLSDAVGIRHTFPSGTVLNAEQAVVVFGGGTPTGSFGGAIVQTTSTLGLTNTGDTVTLRSVTGAPAATATFGSEGGDNQSLTRSPDLTGSFVKHSAASGSGGTLYSPGTRVDGTNFGPPTATVRFAEDAATVTEGGMYSLVVELVDANNDFVVVSVETMCLDDDVTPTSTTRQLSDSTPTGTIRLTATQDMIAEDTETCTYLLSIASQDGNVSVGTPDTFVLTIEDDDVAPFVNNSLLISEFMADPEGSASDASGEYIELFNNTTRPIGLDGYTISDASGNFDVIDGVTIQPGGFVVLCFNSDVNSNGGIESCDFDYADVSLNNTGDDIILQDPAGSVVDIVRYTSSWLLSGVSAVYVGSPNGDNADVGNWVDSISREGRYNDDTVLGDDGSPGTNGVHGNLASPFGVGFANYCYAIEPGFWDDPSIWINCGEGVPGPDDAAAILSDASPGVIADGESIAVRVLVVEADADLVVDTFVEAEVVTFAGSVAVDEQGALYVGTDLSVSGSFFTNDAVALGANVDNGGRIATVTFEHVGEFVDIAGDLTAGRRYEDDAGGIGAGSFRGIFPPLGGVTFDQLNDAFQTQGGIGSDFPDAQPNLYRFDAPTQTFLAITDFTGEFSPDSGYVFYMFDFDLPTTWDVTGYIPEEYALDLHYSEDGDDSNDFNWVPQPFPGPIDFKELYRNSTFSPDSLNATLYVLDPVTEDFRIYNALTGTGAEPGSRGAGRYVAAFQSFVVRPNAPGTTLNYTYDIMDTGESPLLVGRGDFGGEDEASPHVRLELAGEGSVEGLGSTQTYLVFYPDGEEGYDPADAAMLFPFSADYATLVLMDAAGQDLAMDARGLALTTETFNARVATTEPGTYTLTWPTIHEIPAGWSLTLLDTDTGQEVDLRAQSSYTFEVDGPTAARRSTTLSTLHPVQSNTSARFVITVSATTTAGEGTGTAPGEFALDGAYPNPLATTATIRYALPHASEVRLTVYDVLGREVVTLFEGAREAGRYTATVSGLELAGGVYFVRMTAAGFAETKKFVVLN